jgi:hypothetical protein
MDPWSHAASGTGWSDGAGWAGEDACDTEPVTATVARHKAVNPRQTVVPRMTSPSTRGARFPALVLWGLAGGHDVIEVVE